MSRKSSQPTQPDQKYGLRKRHAVSSSMAEERENRGPNSDIDDCTIKNRTAGGGTTAADVNRMLHRQRKRQKFQCAQMYLIILLLFTMSAFAGSYFVMSKLSSCDYSNKNDLDDSTYVTKKNIIEQYNNHSAVDGLHEKKEAIGCQLGDPCPQNADVLTMPAPPRSSRSALPDVDLNTITRRKKTTKTKRSSTVVYFIDHNVANNDGGDSLNGFGLDSDQKNFTEPLLHPPFVYDDYVYFDDLNESIKEKKKRNETNDSGDGHSPKVRGVSHNVKKKVQDYLEGIKVGDKKDDNERLISLEKMISRESNKVKEENDDVYYYSEKYHDNYSKEYKKTPSEPSLDILEKEIIEGKDLHHDDYYSKLDGLEKEITEGKDLHDYYSKESVYKKPSSEPILDGLENKIIEGKDLNHEDYFKETDLDDVDQKTSSELSLDGLENKIIEGKDLHHDDYYSKESDLDDEYKKPSNEPSLNSLEIERKYLDKLELESAQESLDSEALEDDYYSDKKKHDDVNNSEFPSTVSSAQESSASEDTDQLKAVSVEDSYDDYADDYYETGKNHSKGEINEFTIMNGKFTYRSPRIPNWVHESLDAGWAGDDNWDPKKFEDSFSYEGNEDEIAAKTLTVKGYSYSHENRNDHIWDKYDIEEDDYRDTDDVDEELAEGDDEGDDCEEVDWFRSHHPSCNNLHEADLTIDDMKLIGRGYYRNVWITKDGKAVIKTQSVNHGFGTNSYERQRFDAMIMEKLTASPIIVDIFGHCGNTVSTEAVPNEVYKEMIRGNGMTTMAKHLSGKSPKTRNNLNPHEKLVLALELAETLAELHGYIGGVMIHDDVQPYQWLRTENGVLKLNDFNRGEVMFYSNRNQTYCRYKNGSAGGNYRSPEEYADQPLNQQIDVFSLGHIFYSILTGLWVYFDHFETSPVQEKTLNGELPFIDPRYLTKSFAERELIIVMQKCWIYNSDERATIFEVVRDLKRAIHQDIVLKFP